MQWYVPASVATLSGSNGTEPFGSLLKDNPKSSLADFPSILPFDDAASSADFNLIALEWHGSHWFGNICADADEFSFLLMIIATNDLFKRNISRARECLGEDKGADGRRKEFPTRIRRNSTEKKNVPENMDCFAIVIVL
mmetsp:Transcript_10011/g.11488  ORF Transcript_10011/g.11488 Transcript_10011/m.11488 type:complete len:139 (+) Transcript_10011:1069-1485(+)